MSHDEVWAALAEPHRRRVVELLSCGPLTTGQVVDAIPDLSRTAVMKHLDVLESAQLLRAERVGRVRWNHLETRPLESVCMAWLKQRTSAWERSLHKLKRSAERRHAERN